MIQFSLLLFFAILSITPLAAYAERVDICNYQTVSQPSGVACSFYARPGDLIKVWARYRDTSPHNANVILSPYGNALSIPANQEQILTKRILDNQMGMASVNYNIPSYSSGDFLDLDVYTLRSNLRVGLPSIDPNNGDLRIPWSVSSNEPFVPVNYLDVGLWGTVNHGNYAQSLGAWSLSSCVNQGNCSRTIIQPLTQRIPIARGLVRVEAHIDRFNNHIELDESDYDNHKSQYLDDFFVENIPTILNNKAWTLAAQFLNIWVDRPPMVKSINQGIDWTLDRLPLGDTSWIISTNNAVNSRAIYAYNWLLDPAHYASIAAKNALKNRLDASFAAHPSATSRPLSIPWQEGTDVRTYHQQHIQSKSVLYGSFYLDALGAAFGNFTMYLMPRGTAQKLPGKYRVTINRLAVHAVDSFDFNGEQDLGCWGLPNIVSPIPWFGLQCVNNAGFRYYRNMKARGGDYTVFMRPIIFILPTPHIIDIPR